VDPSSALTALEREGDARRGELRPAGREREWCDTEVLRRLRRASLAVLRKEIEAADQRALARVPARAGRASTAIRPRGRRRPAARGASSRCRAWPCRPRSGSATCCRAAPGATRRHGWTSCAPAARSCGSAAGALGRTGGRVALYFREDAEAIGRPAFAALPPRPPSEREHQLVRERLAQSPCFFTDLLAELPLGPEQVQEALWDLVVGGEATNDALRAAARAAADAGRAQRSALERRGAAGRGASARGARGRRRRCRGGGR
jgi:ATP-dependent Lhr-like helicase